jgi:hypothetical protein
MGKELTQFRTTEEFKSRVREFVEGSAEYRNITHFFKVLAEREMSQSDGESLNREAIENAVKDGLSDHDSRLENLEKQLETLADIVEKQDKSRIREIGLRLDENLPLLSSGDEFQWFSWDEYGTPTEEVLEALNEEAPTIVSETNVAMEPHHLRLYGWGRDDAETIEEAREWSTVEAWADVLEERPEDVKRALRWLSGHANLDVTRAEPPVSDEEHQPADRWYRVQF